MSIDERHKVIGKAAEDYVAVKQELATLTHRAQELGTDLRELSEYLTSLGSPNTAESFPRQKSPSSAFSEVESLLRDIQDAKRRRADLRQTLTSIGLELKD